MTGTSTIRFHEILELKLKQTLGTFTNKQMSPIVLRQMRDALFDAVKKVFAASSARLSDRALGWITNQYFKAVQVREESIGDLIIVNDYDLGTFSDEEMDVLNKLFNVTFFGTLIEEELKKREHGSKTEVQ